MPSDTDKTTMCDAEVGALHCLGMCVDWAGSPSCEGEPGLQQFLRDCAEGLRWQRDEIARLRSEVVRLGGVVEQPGAGGF